ncbi:MAG: hypothetical protein JRG71_11585 [Deltaproteobacteria bacterium]|nr:hypothetical protein [Deltaproteobacteria bacterium]
MIQCGHLNVHIGLIGSQNLAIACCGIGKASAAAATTLLVNHFMLSHVLMIGCAGAYPEGGLKLGDLAIASEEIMGDEGVLTPTGFVDMEQLGFAIVQCGEQRFFNRFPTTDTMVERFNTVRTLSNVKQAALSLFLPVAARLYLASSSTTGLRGSSKIWRAQL